MVPQNRDTVKLEDMNVGMLGLKSWEQLTPTQWKERMEDMHWILEMLHCCRVLGGLWHLDWEVAKSMTFREYMEEVRKKVS
jgi:hypothetical protein